MGTGGFQLGQRAAQQGALHVALRKQAQAHRRQRHHVMQGGLFRAERRANEIARPQQAHDHFLAGGIDIADLHQAALDIGANRG